MKAMFAIAFLAIVALYASAVAQESTAESWLKNGYDLSLNGSNEEALQAYDRVIEIEPGNKLAWINKASTLMILNRTDEASEAYQKALDITNETLQSDPENSTIWSEKGLLLHNVGLYEAAVRAFDNATNLDPENEMAWKMKGVLLARDLNRHEDAAKAYDAALQIDPEDAEVWGLKGTALKASGRQAEADAAFARAEELGYQIPDTLQAKAAEGWYQKGQSLMANGSGYNIDEASQAFDNAIRIDPQNIDAWLGKAQSLAYLDKKNESLEAFQNALNLSNGIIEKDPKDAKAWQSKGIALSSLGRDSEAAGAFETSIITLDQSLQSDPEDAEAWWLKAENLELLGRSDSALEAYDKVIELNSSKSVGAWIRKSDIFSGEPGGYNQSQEAFGKAVDLMKVNSTSFISFWYPEKDHVIALNEWMIDGQIARVDFGRYNRSLQAYDDVVQTRTNSNLFAAWQSKGRAITPQGRTLGKQSEYLVGSSLNWVVYNFSRAHLLGNNGSADSRDIFEENTADYWIKRGDALAQDLGDSLEALAAYERAIQIDPDNLDAWDRKALILYALDLQAYRKVLSLTEMRLEETQDARAWQAQVVALTSQGRQEVANQSIKNALEIYDQEIKEDPGNATAWFYKAEITANRTEALTAYEKVIELNGSMRIESLLTKGNILLNLGRSDEATAAIDEAIQSSPNNIDAWIQKAFNSYVLGKYNESLAAYEKAIELVPESASAWIWKGKGDALKALGRQAEADAAFSKAKGMGYEVLSDSEDKSSSIPVRMLAITSIRPTGKDELVEVANSRTVAQSLDGWTLNIGDSRNQSLALPDFTLGPDERINVHLGKGESNERDIFLNSSLTLNDTAGNITLKDESRKDVASFRYRVEPDGSVTGIMTAEGEFSYPPSDQNEVKTVVRAAGCGPYVTERTEYGPDAESIAARLNSSSASATAQNNTAYIWINKAEGFAHNSSFEEAISALDEAFKIEPENETFLICKASYLSVEGRVNESSETYEKALALLNEDLKKDPDDAEAWQWKAAVLRSLSRQSESIAAYEKALEAFSKRIENDPKDADAWIGKGNALMNLGRWDEARDAYNKAIEIGPNFSNAWHGKGESQKAMGQVANASISFLVANKLGYEE